MSAFIQPYSPSMGDVAFGPHLDASAATPYLMIQSSSRMHTDSPMSRSNVATYHPTTSQMTDSSFFEEAIDISPTPVEVDFNSPCTTSPAHPKEPNMPEGDKAPRKVLPTLKSDKIPTRRTRNRRQSLASSAFSDSSTSGLAVEQPKPRKRGRKPKKQLKEEKITEDEEELDDDDLPKDPRRRRILERNRIAATKCRLRKRDEAAALASREQAMEDQNRYLSTCFDSLTTEIYHLKTQLLRHTDCNCKLIQKYIANEAQKSVDGLLACSSAFHSYGGSMSPDYGSSSGGSTAESLNMPPTETDSMPPTWSNPFQEGHKASFSDDMFDMGLESFQKAAMLPDPIISDQTMSNLPLSGYMPGLYVNMGHQEHQAEEVAWSNQWQGR